jgi:hypothetical protein
VDTTVFNDDSRYVITTDKWGNSSDTDVIPPTSEDKKNKSKTHEDNLSGDGGEIVEKEDNVIVDLDEIDPYDVLLAKTYGLVITKRLTRGKEKGYAL